MDAPQFLEEFGHIVNAPGGVARLRQLVISFAITGKLVSLGSSSSIGESAYALVERAEAEKRHVISKGEARRSRPLSPIPIQVKHQYPPQWEVVRLGSIIHLISGQHLKAYEQNTSGLGIPYFTGASDFGWVNPIVTRWTEVRRALAIRGDILISVKGTIGKINVLNMEEAALGRQLMAIRPLAIKPDFIALILKREERNFVSKGIGIAIPGISREHILNLVVGIPPLQEQDRIIAKVNELMTLCDTLEEQQQTRRNLQNNLRQSTLQVVANAQSSYEIQAGWERLESNFGHLFSMPEDVIALKGLVLDLAVSGRLLPPDQKHSSTGQDVLQAIAEARNNWAKSATGQEKKEALEMQKKLRTQRIRIQADPLPDHWCWASLLQVAQVVVDCHNKTAPYVAEGIHLVRTTDIRNGRMDLTKTRKISEETYAYWARRMPPRGGDIFFTREAPMGEAAIVPEGEKVCLGQRTMLIRLFTEHLNNQYLLYVIMSPSFQTRMIEAAIGMAVKHLRVGGVEDLLVPVPTKKEQDRIVACIERLFEICDRYMETLGKKRQLAGSLAANAIGQLTGISIEQEGVEPVKVPQTTLISRLRLGKAPNVKELAPLANLLARHSGELSAQDLWQRFGGEIDAFYAQLKTEVVHGWIEDPSYDLDDSAPEGPRKYPDGWLVAKVVVKEEA
ncbi:restriction endonuclease subunit S [Sodalis ligni]|uniref:Type I restriction enzyme S subunit n=1 Tax=Sodalis ligni TaxID=2697027 RepID=A0A4V2Q3J4_9GAMM|nr:restriction endonuclease subunit S [Sodalis ligni]TCL06988.1 type I restriction enzyme S subunit [Sodalis ligni]